jgi:predicted HAD superfamily hydrolase
LQNKGGRTMLLDKVLKNINNIEVVSFDMFDTLIFRNVSKYEDIFEIVERKTKLLDFKKMRINAEAVARSNASRRDKPDVNLIEIYEYINLPQSIKLEVMRIEIQTEIFFATSNPEVRFVYKKLKEMGKIIIITTDMYLERDSLCLILEKNGYKEHSALIISSEQDKTKWNGELYNVLIEKSGFKPHQILHIGDNYISDYINAIRMGIKAIHYKLDTEIKSKLHKQSQISISIVDSLARNKILENPEIDQFYLYGFKVLGLLLYGFCEHIRIRTVHLGLDKIFFLSRDGYIIKKAWDILYNYPSLSKESAYLFGSRYSYEIAGMETTSKALLIDDIFRMLNRRGIKFGYTINDILYILGVPDVQNSTSINLKAVIRNETDIQQLIHIFEENYELIKDYILNQRELIYGYLSQEGFFEKKRIGFIDLGWRGSVQYAFEKILRHSTRSSPEIYGEYIFLSNEEKTKVIQRLIQMDAYICDPSKNMDLSDWPVREMDFVELFFTAPHGTVIKFKQSVTGIEPEFEENEKELQQYKNIIHKIHLGALDFIEEFHNYASFFLDYISPYDAVLPLKDLALNSSLFDVRQLRGIELFDRKEISTNGREYLAKIPDGKEMIMRINGKFKGKSLGLFKWKYGFTRQLLYHPVVLSLYLIYKFMYIIFKSIKIFNSGFDRWLRLIKRHLITIKLIASVWTDRK